LSQINLKLFCALDALDYNEKKRVEFMEYGRSREIENGRKRNTNRPKQRQDREGRRGDTHLRAWDRVYAGVEVSSFGFVEIAALR